MEPRLFSRGNSPNNPASVWHDRGLQWSHDYLVVETVLSPGDRSTYRLLQWSHDYLVVETQASEPAI